MPLITRKRVWTKQPQTATSIDWFDPLSKDLVAAFVFSNGLLTTGLYVMLDKEALGLRIVLAVTGLSPR